MASTEESDAYTKIGISYPSVSGKDGYLLSVLVDTIPQRYSRVHFLCRMNPDQIIVRTSSKTHQG